MKNTSDADVFSSDDSDWSNDDFDYDEKTEEDYQSWSPFSRRNAVVNYDEDRYKRSVRVHKNYHAMKHFVSLL